jgi:hypothetical protein
VAREEEIIGLVRGNAGKGRKKGAKNKKTLEREALREEVRAEIAGLASELVQAQVRNALGLSYLVRRDKRTGKFVSASVGHSPKLSRCNWSAEGQHFTAAGGPGCRRRRPMIQPSRSLCLN